MKPTQLMFVAVCLVFCLGQAEGVVYIDDGGMHIIDYTINDSVIISGEQTCVTLVEGGRVENINVAANGPSFSMTGGVIEGSLYACSYNPVYITGGTIGENLGLDASSSNGGENGDVYIYGTDFMINGVAVDYGTYSTSGTLYGVLMNGDILNCTFWSFAANDIILIPEPATLLLFALGAAVIKKR